MQTFDYCFQSPSDATEYSQWLQGKGFSVTRSELPRSTKVSAVVDGETLEYLKGAEEFGPFPFDNSDYR